MLGSLREIRLARKISLRRLAGKIGVHPTNLSRAEKSQIIPSVIVAMRWANALDIDLGELYRAALNSVDGHNNIL
ncbi:helix-turn-helix domain-containing protein [Luteolibacter algae]|uniref:Helix-turn-helix domain-containing protein n=1 Tax=Luteolibacter algae TaxID=454151 RepID=A0ABW5D7Z4_9BACT